MIFRKNSLFFFESFLESVNSLFLKSFGRITAAAVTGPAKQPRPTSSVPHSIRLEYELINILIKIKNFKIIK